jgi:hypothetical protein
MLAAEAVEFLIMALLPVLVVLEAAVRVLLEPQAHQ